MSIDMVENILAESHSVERGADVRGRVAGPRQEDRHHGIPPAPLRAKHGLRSPLPVITHLFPGHDFSNLFVYPQSPNC